MHDRPSELVRVTLAHHLDVGLAQVHPGARLVDDLGMDPLDLVLVALRMEEIEEREFPISDLEEVRTVEELVSIVHEWLRPVPTRSGLLPHIDVSTVVAT